MRTLAGILFALVALFAGGCSLLFAINDLGGGGLGVGIIWGPGLLLGGLCGWGAYTLLSTPNTGTPAAKASNDAKAADTPKSDNW